jgi:hypothetical protein
MDQSNFPQQPPQPPPYNQFPQNEEKQRHGCVTAWLILMIIGNSIGALMYLFGSEMIMRAMPYGVSSSLIYLLAFVSVMNVVFAVLLFQWKRWGFYGFIGSAIAAFIINTSIGLPVGSSLLGLVGIGVLFAILQIKQNGVSAWDNMD